MGFKTPTARQGPTPPQKEGHEDQHQDRRAARRADAARDPYCSGFPKKKAKGQKLSSYERCLTSMAKTVAAKKTPKIACTGFSKKHVKGKTGTEFSRCVVAAGEAKREGAL